MNPPQPVRPVEASTVIMTRPSLSPGCAWECYMIRRPVGSDFAANVYVFPGGKVDPADSDHGLAQVCREPAWDMNIGQPERSLGRACRVAAIRELFEEVGVLIAERDGRPIDMEGSSTECFAGYRQNVIQTELTLLQMAEQEGLLYPLDRLNAVARWITPESYPRRFDTLFYVTTLPPMQEARPHQHETSDGLWIAPADALARYQAGSFPLVFATEKTLEMLADYETVEALIASTSSSSLNPITPRPITVAGETRFLLPGDAGYEAR